jgi:hypothetical protein
MKIQIEYKLRDNNNIALVHLDPSVYFDTVDLGENFEDDAIPKYGDTIKFILENDKSIKKESIEYTSLTISDSLKSDKVEKITYLHNDNELRYTIDFKGWELIVQSIKVAENCIVITRMERESVLSEWHNISYSTLLNPSTDNEIYYSSGDYIKDNIVDNSREK